MFIAILSNATRRMFIFVNRCSPLVLAQVPLAVVSEKIHIYKINLTD